MSSDFYTTPAGPAPCSGWGERVGRVLPHRGAALQNAGMLKQELKKYTRPDLLILDELGYLPIDKTGADLGKELSDER